MGFEALFKTKSKVRRDVGANTGRRFGLESNLPRVTKLQRNLENQECKIDDPYQFYRQYVGIVVRGRREIYVNAFSFPTDDQWLTQFVRICDGGGSVWGALYDPSTGKFHDLETNGGL